MLLGIALVLVVLWALGLFLSSLGSIIHFVLVLAVVIAAGHFLRGAGGRSTA